MKRGSKKETESSPLKVDPVVKVTKTITKPIVTEIVNPSTDVIPSKTRILKRLKKKTHKPCHSRESSVETPITHGEKTKPSTPEQTLVIPLEVSLTESFHEEVRTSNTTEKVYDTNTHVNMGEGVLSTEAQGANFIISSSFPTTNLDTTVSLPPYIM
ncbi:unnamed protein product [Lactuca saligna]|uniref:Uncharacterized protein n=1 Tax=Lactuca saligna TaxID=75948 RepID=A0AA36E566_LACSI|nr:unnamed protein product [Lactuca saligna]